MIQCQLSTVFGIINHWMDLGGGGSLVCSNSENIHIHFVFLQIFKASV